MRKNALCALAVLGLMITAPVGAQSMKWHPGHYVMLSGGASQASHFANIDEIAKEPVIKGVQVRIWWHKLEKSKGVYDFSSIDAYLTKLKSLPVTKRLVIRVMDRRFNTTSTSGIVPDYLRSEAIYKGGIIQTKTGYAARLWEQPVMDRLIALYRAMGARYDSDPHFEGIASEETTLSLKSIPAGYSNSALGAQYERLAATVRPAMPRTNLFLYTNFIGSDSVMSELIQSLVAPQVAAGGSNVKPNAMTLGQRVWTGALGADYRGLLALSSSVERAELGNFTAKQINDFAYNTLQVNYLFWVRAGSGTSQQKWSTGVLPFLRTNPPIRTSCPASYGSCAN
jgi:hypothetical protein